MGAPLSYHLSIADIPGQRLQVEIDLKAAPTDQPLFRLPVWVPGSYLIREYAGQVIDFEAFRDGETVEATKIDKTTWQVDVPQGASCRVRYTLYAGELTVRTSDISHEHAFIHPPAAFMHVEGLPDGPLELRVNPPKDWRVHTALESTATHVFRANDYDELLDSPLEMGPFDAHRFDVRGVPHQLVVAGEGNLDVAKVVRDTQAIVESEADLFGEIPYPHYLFILLLTHDRGGGLEHRNSSALAWPKLKFRPASNYRRFLTLVAHELFHAWNVKRIRPEAFREFDYSKEQYTRLLWVFEGITSYYDELIPMRAGLYKPRHYFELFSDHAVSEAGRPGRHVQSLRDSSFDAWIKHYRPSPDSANSQVSYYERGQLVALLLDLFLRRSTGGERSLDDVMRGLWGRYKQDVLLAEEGLAAVIDETTAVDARDFLRNNVEGTGHLDYAEALAWIGLQTSTQGNGEDRAWMGVTLGGGGSMLSSVFQGGPAHVSGLMAGDEIIALDGHRIRGDLDSRVALFQPGESVAWTAFRRDRMIEGKLTFAELPNPAFSIKPLTNVTEGQKKQFESWAHVKWPFDQAKA